jgi:hypothetical protein
MVTCQFCKAKPPPRDLRQHQRRVRSRSDSFAGALSVWLQRYARLAAKVIIDDLRAKGPIGTLDAIDNPPIRKADTFSGLSAELRRMIQLFGLRQMDSAGKRGAGLVGVQHVALPPDVLDEYFATREPYTQSILAQSAEAVQLSVRDIIEDGLRETPQPSAGELARRIRTQFHGDVGGKPGPVVEEPRTRGRLPATRFPVKDGVLYAFSSERAAFIARTELNIAENTGLVAQYRAVGVKRIRWLAMTGDRRSGPRKHWEMNGEERDLRGPWFVLPSGEEMPWPGWVGAPLRETANCRCSSRPVK